MSIQFKVNGKTVSSNSEGDTPLLWVIRDELGLIQRAEEVGPLAASVPDAGGVCFVPAFTGLGSPFWRSDARGSLMGLSRGSGRAQIARAVVEALAFQVRAMTDAFRDAGVPVQELRADGGAAGQTVVAIGGPGALATALADAARAIRLFHIDGFNVFEIGADIADMGEGEGNDLSGIRGVGQNFLIARHRSVETDFAFRLALRANRLAFDHGAVGKDKQRGGDRLHPALGGSQRTGGREASMRGHGANLGPRGGKGADELSGQSHPIGCSAPSVNGRLALPLRFCKGFSHDLSEFLEESGPWRCAKASPN